MSFICVNLCFIRGFPNAGRPASRFELTLGNAPVGRSEKMRARRAKVTLSDSNTKTADVVYASPWTDASSVGFLPRLV